ncbi:ovochymase-1 [Ambystoma mexicanum]|uniref:ovochymase-1 n=1 Tax=Ambystoma mexicanum TaxID=8296 RepID=UPI0037E951C5
MNTTTSLHFLALLFLVAHLQDAFAAPSSTHVERERELLRLLSAQRSQRSSEDLSYTGPKCGSIPVLSGTRRTGFTGRIIGGVNAVKGEQPWLVSLKRDIAFCGGSIIKEDLVVTASHCLVDLTPSELLELIVVAGEYDAFVEEGIEQTTSVARVELHPQYNTRGNFNNDIALLYLATPLQFGKYVQPICLPHPDDYFAVGTLCSVTGWGLTSEGGKMSAKQQIVKLPIIDQAMCNYALTSQDITSIDDTCLCAGFPSGGRDACQGDSGGPLACKVSSGSWVLVGVVSFGIGCGRAWDNASLVLDTGSPGLFARVSKLMSFVTKGTATGRLGNPSASETDEPGNPEPNDGNIQEGCSEEGLQLSGRTGTIQFPPGSGKNYANNCVCLWTISVTAGNYIQVTFTKLDIEKSPNCAFDYLSIIQADKTLVDKVCGTVLPSTLLVHSSQATVKFVSDYSVAATGFALSFMQVAVNGREDSGCGSLATLQKAGTIDTINYPGPYTPLTECHWLIQAPLAYAVQFVFEDFCLEYDKNCNYDKVSFFDDEQQTILLATFCGCSLPANVTSRRNTMKIHFKSDQESNYRGFKGRFDFIPRDPSTENSPVVTPARVRAQIPKVVALDVCGVAPYSCMWQSARIVGGEEARQNCWPWQVRIRVKNSQRCGGTIINSQWILTASHCIKNDSLSLYSVVAGDHDRCITDTTEQVRQVVRVVTHELFDAITFDYDIALIQLNESLVFNDYVRPVCLPISNKVVVPSTVCIVTGWGSTEEGARSTCRLQQVQLPVMDRTICSKMYFDQYSIRLTNSMFCAGGLGGKDACQGDSGGPMLCQNANGAYTIEGIVSWGIGCARPKTPGVFTVVPYFLEWIANSVQGSEMGSSRSGESIPEVQRAEHPPSIQPKIPYEECVQQTLTDSIGTFTSPGYPLGYPGGLDCSWLIPISSRSALKLEVVHLSIETSEGCTKEALSIQEMGENKMNLLDTLCGTHEYRTYVSKASLVKLTFSTDGKSLPGSHGFVVKYKLYSGSVSKSLGSVSQTPEHVSKKSCADVVLTEGNGIIQSPGYPNNYPNDARCEWRIIANLTTVITIYIKDFNTENAQSGDQDQLLIYEGTDDCKKLLGNLSGEVPPTAIKSEGAQVTLIFISNSDVTHTGFSLTYTAHELKSRTSSTEQSTDGCPVLDLIPVGDLGTVDVKLPSYPRTYVNQCDCKFTIYSQSGERLKLKIYDLGIEYSPNCIFDSLKVYDGPTTSSRLLGNLCGDEKGIILQSTGNYLTLHFQTDQSVGGRGFNGTCTEVTAESLQQTRSDQPARACGKPAVQPMLENCSPEHDLTVPLDEKASPRIVGGRDACPSSLPWVVSMQDEGRKHSCAACIISPTFLLTAAHCPVSPSGTRILVGRTRLAEANSNDYSFVKKVYKTPQYDEDAFPPLLDIMLVELTKPLNIAPNSIICLPEIDEEPSLSSECLIAGWGVTEGTSIKASPVLQQASVSLISNAVCILQYWDVDVGPTNICAGHLGVSSSCLGDSGGPLMCKHEGSYKLVGVVSWGSGECDTNIPAVYTRVSMFRSWIDEVIGNAESGGSQ